MTKFILAALVSFSLGCASTPKASTTTTYEGVYTPKPTVVEGKTWTMKFPPSWDVKVTPDNAVKKDEIRIEVLAQTRNKFGAGPAIIALATVDLSGKQDVQDGSFAERYHVALVTDTSNEVLRSKPIVYDGQPARLIFYVNNKGQIGNIALITDKNRVGYVLKCVGDAKHIITVASACGTAIKSFTLK